MAKKSPVKSSQKFQFSWIKLLVGLSLALNLASIVLFITLMRTTYFDNAMLNTVVSRDLDDNGCYKSNLITPNSSDPAGTKYCLQTVVVSPNNVVTHPESLKGQTYPFAK